MTTAAQLRRHVAKNHPAFYLRHGWILAGAGSARWGWGLVSPAGRTRYLGRSADDAAISLSALRPGF